ncbi:hypothetical protein V5F49_11700 [Xanthobacter sp. V3C-3]|uniref:hypothetical protein n=1 Tax=Xanthobacter lutulentifluminis TaxID=3119935 RepID=UPI00372639F7
MRAKKCKKASRVTNQIVLESRAIPLFGIGWLTSYSRISRPRKPLRALRDRVGADAWGVRSFKKRAASSLRRPPQRGDGGLMRAVTGGTGRLARAPAARPKFGARRRLLTWALCYLALLQAFSGSVASASMAARLALDGAHCLGRLHDDGQPARDVAAPCYDACAIGGTPVLPAPAEPPRSIFRSAGVACPVPAGLLPGAIPVCENARPRAPPPA